MSLISKILFLIILLTAFLCETQAQNLIVIPSAELPPIGNGWAQVSGGWQQADTVANISPHVGNYFFFADSTSEGELYQDIDGSNFSQYIDNNSATFSFSGYIQSYDQPGSSDADHSREIVEYRNSNGNILDTFDSKYQVHYEWFHISDARIAPIGTRIIRKRLLAQRHIGPGNHGLDDDLSLTFSNTDTFETYYKDADGDGYGNPLIDSFAAFKPEGYVLNSTDCNDNDSSGHLKPLTIQVAITPNDSVNIGTTINLLSNQSMQLSGPNTHTPYGQSALDVQPTAMPTTTWEAWVYPVQTSGLRQTIFGDDNGGYDRTVVIEKNSTNFGVFTGSGVWQPIAVTFNEWQHIAVVYTPTNIKFYKNGVEYSYNSIETGGTTSNFFNIGNNQSFSNEEFTGNVDEVRVWNIERTQSQIQANMNVDVDPTDSGLVANWKMNKILNGIIQSEVENNKYPLNFTGQLSNDYPTAFNSAYSYNWQPTTGLSNLNGQNTNFIATQNVSYQLIATTSYKCTTVSETAAIYVTPCKDDTICGTVNEGQTLTLTASPGYVFTLINFASYGTPTGSSCGNFAIGTCNATGSTSIVENAALGKNSFSIAASNSIFGDPCYGTVKRLYVQATATSSTCTKQNQTIIFDPIPTKSFGDSAFALHATASSGLPVIFNIVSGSASISNDSILTINGAGYITVEASQNGDSLYNPAFPVQQTFEVIKAVQQVTFNVQLDTTSSEERYLLLATASSGLPVSYSVISGYGTITGDTLSFSGSGLVTVRATQPGNQNYASDYEEKTFCIAPNQPGEISGFTQTCIGTQTYSVPALPGVNFSWHLSGGGTLSSTTGTSVKVTWTALGTYTLTVTSSTPCDTADMPSRSVTVQVINNTIPGAATNLYPPSGTVISNSPFSLSWKPGENADMYDVFIWEADSTEPASPVASNLRQIGYVVSPQVLPHYGAGKIYKWQVVSKNGCAQTASVIQSFTIGYLPDLIATSVNVADSVYSGDFIDISAQVRNIGKMATSTSWQDAFYLSKDSVFDDPRLYPGVDTYLGARPNVSYLGIDTSYTTSFRVALPEKVIDSNYIIVRTNAFANQSESDYGNNTAYKAFKILLTTPPDLIVDSLQTPAAVFSGQQITVNYTVRNTGAETIRDSVWKDAIYISPNSTFVETEAIKLAETTHYGKLINNAYYSNETIVSIPQYIFGDYYIHVITDVTDQVYEVTGENNNVKTSDLFTVYLTPPPDFIVSQVQTTSVASAGEAISLNYTVQNIGASKPAQYGTQWTDYYFISHDSIFNSNAVVIGASTLSPGPAMNAGDIYSKTVNLTNPANFIGTGYLFVYTDYRNNVYEYQSENNNTGRAIILVNNPDLITAITNIPGTATAGNSLDISWQVQNIGNGKIVPMNRTDIVWMSSNPVFNNSTSFQLGTVSYSSTLDTGSSLIKETSVNLPDSVAGTRYFFIQTDAYNTITETNENNNVSAGKSVVISLSPETDLHVDSVVVSPTTINAGDNFNLTYTVSNIGIGDITGKSWVDKVYRSHDTILNSNASLINIIPESRSLPSNSSYQELITLSSSLGDLNNKDTGYWYYYIVTDANNDVYEHNAENNNTQRSNLLTITHQAFPDLSVTDASGAAAVASGKLTTVTWTVKNAGGTTGFNNYWYDAVYFSKDSLLSGDDILASAKTIYGPLASGSSYTQKSNVTVPNGLSGTYYMLLVSDYTGLNRDVNRSNNSKTVATSVGGGGNSDTITVHITLSASPDLTVNTFATPSVGYAGQPVLAKWMVSNIGDTITTKPAWNEYIYLSTDANIDASDRLLQTYTRTQPLQNGASYSDSTLVFLPANISGNYYLLFKTDGSNAIYEYDGENNNTASSFIFITQPAPCDLTVSNISMPMQAAIGDTIPVKWQTNNIGQNPATGYLRQGIYLSKDAVWDAGDVLLSDNLYQVNIPPAGDSLYSQNVRLTSTLPGSNYIIVRTDLLNNITELDETNNTSVSVQTINVTIPDLPINVLTPAVLKNYQELYYKIDVPDSLAGSTLLISLKGDTANALNELYVKLDSIPTRINHDYMYSNPVSGSQDIVIPALSKGTYYILAYGASSQAPQQNITLLATPINFTVLNVTANQGGNTGTVTVKITGAKFDSTVQATLKNGAGTYTATKIKYINSASLYATFNLNGATIGTYDLILTKTSEQPATLPDGFSIVAGTGGGITGGTSGSGFFCNIVNAGDDASLQTNVNHPDGYKPAIAFPMYVVYGNSGNVDIPIPQLILQSLSGANIGDTPEDALLGSLFDLLLALSEANGPDDVLRPGATFTKTFYSVLPVDGAPHSLYEYQLLQK